MKCPKCGKVLQDGNLFCENCGEEINIVPDYDPDTDLSVDIKGVFDRTREIDTEEVKKQKHKKSSGEFGKRNSVLEDDDEFEDEDSSEVGAIKDIVLSIIDFWNKNIVSKILVVALGISVIIACIAIGVFISGLIKKHNIEYYVTQAEDSANNKDYDSAIKYYEKAIEKDPGNIDIKYAVSDCYLKDDQFMNAVFILREIANENPAYMNDAYEKMFNILYERNEWGKINEILLECEDESIQNKFKEYLCKAPVFSEKGGEYEDTINLELSASPYGRVYYTLDGTDPDETSFEYNDGIFLESGEYDVKAVFISDNGVRSEVAEEEFNIKILIPLAPQVSIESGSYNVPITITVTSDFNCETYYVCYRATDKEADRVDPDMEATLYEYPLLMPMGPSEFRFISYNEEGVPSTVITRKYNVKIENAAVSMADAANIATVYRYSLGGLTDTDGHVTTANGKFEFIIEDAVNIKGTIYYVINEYYVDPSNPKLRSLTGLRYAVNINDAADFGTLEMNAKGEFYVIKQRGVVTE